MESKNKKLEVPSKESQIIRKETMVQKLLNKQQPLDRSKPQRSSILSQVKAFIPQIKTANEQLQNADKSSIQLDGEVAEGQPYVEMDLQLYEEDNTDNDSSEDDEDPQPSKQQTLVTNITKDVKIDQGEPTKDLT